MPEPTISATATIVSGAVVVPALTAFGVPLGLRPDLLIAGFSGALVAIVLLDAVPSSGDTWRELIRTTNRRIWVACASSVTAGYLTPLLLVIAALPDPLLLSFSFVVGAGAQKLLRKVIDRYAAKAGAAEEGKPV